MKNGSIRFSRLIDKPAHLQNGFVYLWALFSVVLAGVTMAGAGQMWQVKSQRDKEAELLFIGEEFRKAIMSYHNATKQYPSSLDELLKDSRSVNIKRHLRKIYVDPMTNTTEWGLVDEPPPATTTATSKAGSTQDKGSTTGSGATSSAGGSSSSSSAGAGGNPSANNPNSTTALNPTGSTGQTTTPGQTSTTNPASNVGTTPESKPPATSSSGMSSSIGTKIIGVYSLSEKKPIKKDRFPEQYAKFKEALTYRDWQFVYKPDAKSAGASATGSGASSTKSGGAAAGGAANSPFSPSTSSSSRGGAPASPGGSPGASPFGSPSQPTAPRGGAASPFGPSAADDD